MPAQHRADDGPDFGAKRDDGDKSMEDRIRDLEVSLAATRAQLPTSLLPEHSAGPGTDIAPTWSQAEQEQSIASSSKPPSARP